jgi:hypothetical protein
MALIKRGSFPVIQEETEGWSPEKIEAAEKAHKLQQKKKKAKK